MKTIPAKLINSLRSGSGVTQIDPTTIILSIFGYTKEVAEKKSGKLSFKLGTMATVEEMAILMDLMGIAGFQATDIDSPAMLTQSTPDSVLKQLTVADLESKIRNLLDAAEDDAGEIYIDQLWDAYVLARYLRKRKIVKIVVITSIAVIAAAAIATGLIMFLGGNDETEEEIVVSDVGEPEVTIDDDDDDVAGDAPIVVTDDDIIEP